MLLVIDYVNFSTCPTILTRGPTFLIFLKYGPINNDVCKIIFILHLFYFDLHY